VDHRKVTLADLPDALEEVPVGISVVEVTTSRTRLAELHAGL